MTYNVLTLLGSVWLSVFVLMSIVWLIFLKIKQASIVDVFWSLAITLSACIWGCGAAHSWPVMTLKSLLIIWAVRLAGYLFFTRILPGHTDRRYDQLSAHWSISKQLGFFLNFQLQGALAMIIACPFYWLDSFTGVGGFYVIAVIMITFGWIGECMSDYQLRQFQLSHPKQVCQTGLWRYSRHPNCFFDWLIWLGFAVAV
ncbi:DUF1295 domain-containing protein, partial [Gammaproteobacteria bacterium]|nr:DUF1295 domain-containing protein [Gammaproteobacteria bacterium]